MKKVKIMLLSLALLAVVGGALAFKAKLQIFPFCTTDAFYAQSLGYFCSFRILPNGVVTTDNPTIFAACEDFLEGFQTDEFAPDYLKKVCTTTHPWIGNDIECQIESCPDRISTTYN